MAIGPTVWKLVADPRKFTEGLTVTRRELAAARKVTEEMTTPQEKFGEQLSQLRSLLNKNTISVQAYQRAEAALYAEQPENIARREAAMKVEQKAISIREKAMSAERKLAREAKMAREALKAGSITQDEYNRYRKELVAQMPSVVAAEAARNKQLLVAQHIIRGVTTETERYRQSVIEAKAALDRGDISQQQYDRRLKQLKTELPAVRREEERRKKLQQEAASITNRMISVEARHTAEVRKLNEMVRRGYLSQENYNRRIRELNAMLPRTESLLRRTGRAMHGMRMPPLSFAGYSIGIFGTVMAMRSLITTNEAFEQSMASSLAITKDVSPQIRKEMELTARQVAYNTKFSTAEAGQAYYYLFSAGIDAAGALKAMPQVAKFAQAGMFDLSLATDLATDAQSALGLRSDDATKNLAGLTRVTDVLVRGAQLANASVEQFSLALTNKAGPAARLVGKDIEEMVAVLAVYADQGVKAEVAGTAISIVLRDLQTQAIKNADAFAKNKVTVFDAGGEMRSLADIVSDLEKRMVGLSDQAKKELLLELGFTDKSMAFTTQLVGTSEQIRKYEAELRNAGNATQEVADKQIPPLTAALERLKASWSLFSDGSGDAAFPILASLTGAKEEIGLLNKVFATTVELLEVFGFGWELARVAIIGLQEPLATLQMGMIARNSILENTFGKDSAISAMLIGAYGGAGVAIEPSKDLAARAIKENEEYYKSVGKIADGLKDKFLESQSASEKYLATLAKMREPLNSDPGSKAPDPLDEAAQKELARKEMERKADEAAAEATKKREETEKKHAKTVSDALAGMKRDVADFGKSADQLQIDKLFRVGATMDQLLAVRALQKELAKLTTAEKLRERIQQELESTKTPEEKRLERIEEIDSWYAKKAITIDQHARLVKHAREELAKPFTIGKFDGVEVNTFGSAEMMRSLAARRDQMRLERQEAAREAELNVKQPPKREITMMLDVVPPFEAGGKETKDAETHRLLNEAISVLTETRDKMPAITGSSI